MKTVLALLLASLCQSVAWAESQDTSLTDAVKSTASLEEVAPKEEMNKDQITNSRLAAEAGSMSKYSMRALLGYSGGSIAKPFDKERPNYRALPGAPLEETSFGGSIGGAYRLDEESSLRFGVGVSMRTPFHNTLNEVRTNVRPDGSPVFNVSTPSIEYNKTFRVGNVMLSPSVSYSHATDNWDTEVLGTQGWLGLGSDVIFEIEGSKWMPGFSVWATQSLYRDSSYTVLVPRAEGGSKVASRSNLELGVYPYVEYQFNEKIAYRALFGLFNFNNYRGQNLPDFTRDSNYISTGIGITPSRDIWIYPNLQFNPNNPRADMTNVGISTVINL